MTALVHFAKKLLQGDANTVGSKQISYLGPNQLDGIAGHEYMVIV